ncbi:muscarinic acetylcholine receptor M3-like [Lytechinus variegatus]|uniref:muscarinic acetylcholine receptor M3-like n=1 Tax=Lytechinus variegatus TaxID=7654 RepID=UPI001BB1B5EF|nr:muscarinic acetylcholine receptor M3-like [Lytechinus variegatus]
MEVSNAYYGQTYKSDRGYVTPIIDQMTSSSNTTSDDITDYQPSIAWLVIVPLVVGTITIATVLGNALVMVAFFKDPRINSRVASLLILNLAISDFIIGLVVLSVNLSWITWNEWLGGEFWLLGEVFCKIWLIIDNTATLLSVFTIILISLDRYWLLTKKLHYQTFQTRKRVLVTITILWVSTAVVYTILAVGWPYFTGERNVDFSKECELDMAYNVYATIAQLICEFVIPLIIIICLNIAVYIKIRKRAKGLSELKTRSKREQNVDIVEMNRLPSPIESPVSLSHISLVNTSDSKHELREQVNESSFVNGDVKDYQTMPRDRELSQTLKSVAEAQKRKREFARHRRAATVLGILVSVFIACWLPYQIANIVNAICDECISDLVWEIVNNILWCNSFINPFLYAATNVHFRRNFIILLGLRKCRCFRTTMQVEVRPSSTVEQIRQRYRNTQQK